MRRPLASLPPVLDAHAPTATCALAALAALLTLATAAALALDGEGRLLSAQARGIEVAVGGGGARAQRIAAMLRARGDVATAAPGDPVAAGEPALIDVALAEGASAEGVRRALAGLPGVAMVESGAAVRPLARAIDTLLRAAIAVAVAAVLATMATAALAARALVVAEAATVDMIERLGARDAQLAGLLARGAARCGLAGGAIGTGTAGAAILFIATHPAGADSGPMDGFRLAIEGWLLLAALPLLLAGAGALAAYAGALVTLGRRR